MVKFIGVVEIFAIVEFLISTIATNNLGSRHEIFSKLPLFALNIEILIEKALDL